VSQRLRASWGSHESNRPSKTAPEPELSASSLVTANSERTTGFEPALPTLAIAWRMSHESQSVSPVSLSCMAAAFYGWVLEWPVVNRQGPPVTWCFGDNTPYAYASGQAPSGHTRAKCPLDGQRMPCRAVASHKEELNGWCVDSGLWPRGLVAQDATALVFAQAPHRGGGNW
jgi:hypothetical protein